jgi:hypothetical protein
MTCQEALYALGVRENTLSEEEKLKLDRDGFLPLPGILSSEQIAQMRTAIENLFALEKTGEEGGPSECGNMQNKAPDFDICLTHPRVLAAIAHVLREDFISLGVHSRPNPPGCGHQAFHVDYPYDAFKSGPPTKPGAYCVCNSIWLLTDFTEDNGATRVVPGSHLSGKHPKDAIDDLNAPHPREIKLLGSAGTVIVFNSHLWHGATLNRSVDDRPAVTSFWRRRDDPYMANSFSPSALSVEAFARVSEAVRCLFETHDA